MMTFGMLLIVGVVVHVFAGWTGVAIYLAVIVVLCIAAALVRASARDQLTRDEMFGLPTADQCDDLGADASVHLARPYTLTESYRHD